MAANKFAGIFTATGRDTIEETEPIASSEPQSGHTLTIKRGRPNGKRSSSEYTQTTAYIKRQTHSQVMLALSNAKYNGTGQTSDFSVLVESLLSKWLNNQKIG
jgi:hypothetical protein